MSEENVLIMMAGLPRSGKTTYCKKYLLPHFPIVNPDSIRLAIHGQRFLLKQGSKVWYHVKIMVDSLFLAGHKYVVLDATSTTKRDRKNWKSDKWKRFYIHIDTPMEECIKRLDDTNQDLIEIIKKMNDRFQLISDDEYDIKLDLEEILDIKR